MGRRKKSWLRNIREWTGISSANELFRLAKDKTAYAKLTANLHYLERHQKKMKKKEDAGRKSLPTDTCGGPKRRSMFSSGRLMAEMVMMVR